MSQTLVIAYGNPLRGDDGVGWTVAALVAARALPCRVLTLHQLLPELAEELACHEQAIFVDASAALPAGALALTPLHIPEDELADEPFSHHLTPRRLLALAQKLYGRAAHAWLLSIGGEHFGFSEQITPIVQTAAARAADAIAELARGASPSSGHLR